MTEQREYDTSELTELDLETLELTAGGGTLTTAGGRGDGDGTGSGSCAGIGYLGGGG